MNMADLKQLVSLYIDGQATPEQEDTVLSSLRDSAELRAYYEELLAVSASLRMVPEESLSPDWEQTLQRHFLKQEARTMKRSYLIPMTATLAVAILVVLTGQQYVQKTMQARIRAAMDDIGDQWDTDLPQLRSPHQAQPDYAKGPRYQPYYLDKQYEVAGTDSLSRGIQGAVMSSEPVRYEAKGGYGTYGQEAESRSWPVEDRWDSGLTWNAPTMSEPFNTEQYDVIADNEFQHVTDHPLSTFSIDVDTASYANLRRFITAGQTPPADAVRIEEMINYFVYDYPQPAGNDPFSVNIELGACPWNPTHQLAMIGLQGRSLDASTIPASNLVFLIDVSGSMQDANKLPLLKQGFAMMVNQLRADEKVSIVTYAGQAGVLLEGVSGANKQQILTAIDQLQASGSTAGAQGILTAYEIARRYLIPGGNNRVILATDGDFNIGVSSDGELTRLIEERRRDGIFLTVLGFGMGNYKDGKMEKLADKGNGNYYYIDTEREAKKVMVQELGSTLFTIAKDVKLQIEFNPAEVKAYRLIGYENRKLNKEDFNDDTKDAGELGAGHTVTAFYEIIPASSTEEIGSSVDPLKYQTAPAAPAASSGSGEVMTVKLRYKEPNADTSRLIARAVTAADIASSPSANYQFASAVAEFGMLLRNSPFKAQASFASVLSRAQAARGQDAFGYRQEFIDLVTRAQGLVPVTFSTGYGFKGQH